VRYKDVPHDATRSPGLALCRFGGRFGGGLLSFSIAAGRAKKLKESRNRGVSIGADSPPGQNAAQIPLDYR